MEIKKHTSLEAADPDAATVILFRCDDGIVRGWYFGPVTTETVSHLSWRASPDEKLLGPVALVRAWEIAAHLGRPLCVVDPDDLWPLLSGGEPFRPA